MSGHGFDRRYGPWIYCLCGWSAHSLFDRLQDRALHKHIAAHRGTDCP